MPSHPLPRAEDIERASAIVTRLPLRERIALVSGHDDWTTESVPGAGPIWLADGPHGLRKQTGQGDHVGIGASEPATCFPPATTLGSTWDVDLVEEVGAALGAQARVQEVTVVLGPGLNIKRNPRGGRSFEYFSEDPHLSGALASAMVRGIQSQGVAACPKHFAANNHESHRMIVDTLVDERTLRELYLRAFQTVVTQAEPATIMTSYNKVNGQYMSDNSHLLADVLRDEWGFAGLVMSDWGGTNDRIAGLRAGMDLEMPGGASAFDDEVAAAIADGRLDSSDLDDAAIRVVAAALRWQTIQAEGFATADDLYETHHRLARRAAAAGAVLLTNDGLLPLAAAGTIGVVGAFAESPRYQGAGSSKVNPTQLDALLPALRDQVGGQAEVRYAPGYDPVTGRTSAALLAQAATVAADSDVVVLVVGLPAREETEGLDRPHCRLPEDMGHVLDVVTSANPRTAVVIVNGGVVELPWAHRPAAVLEAFLGGQAGGSALADVLLGAVEPGGRLAESIPYHCEELASSANFPGRPRQVQYREGLMVGYRFHDTAGVPAHFPFGHGLGYTTMDLTDLAVTGSGADLTVTVTAHNTGSRAGAAVVQLYVSDPASTLPRPDKELAGFVKVVLESGESRPVSITLDRSAFAVWDVASGGWRVESGDFVLKVGLSSTDLRAQTTVHVDSPDEVRPPAAVADVVATDEQFAALLGHPIPTPQPVRPFTRNTTLPELGASRMGAGVARLLRTVANRQVDPADLDSSEEMVRAGIEELPLRGFVLFSRGALSLVQLDRLLGLLNARVPRLSRVPRLPGRAQR